MNERIKELAEQATTIVDTVNSQGYSSSYANFDREKFARLIVRECIWAFHETRTEPSLEKYILDRLGINNESR
jgi:hypothetical protein